MLRYMIAMAFIAACLPAQITPLGAVGIGQTVPDPYYVNGPAGQTSLSGHWCPTYGLRFFLTGMPLGYNSASPVTMETIHLALNSGASTLPGVGTGGGQFYIPLANVILGDGAPSIYLGPEAQCLALGPSICRELLASTSPTGACGISAHFQLEISALSPFKPTSLTPCWAVSSLRMQSTSAFHRHSLSAEALARYRS